MGDLIAMKPRREFKKAGPKEIKRALKKEFPGVKFSVTRGRGTAWHWINVRWTDGPREAKVREFLGAYNDKANDDIMTDLFCGSQYTSESRTLSPEAIIIAAGIVAKREGLPKPRLRLRVQTVNRWGLGRKFVEFCEDPAVNNDEPLSVLAHREARSMDF